LLLDYCVQSTAATLEWQFELAGKEALSRKLIVTSARPLRMYYEGVVSEPAPTEVAELLLGLRQGNSDAWRALAATYRERLRDMAASALPDEVARRADASDIVQQTLTEVNESFASFRGATLPELFAWIAAILRHNVNDAVRQHVMAERRSVRSERCLENDSGSGFDVVSAADQTSPSMAAARAEIQPRLEAALDRLPERQRKAVRMRHLEGRPLADIAEKLGCNPQAAAAVIARGLRALRDELKDLEI
jgi:RNA polymerase sigma-70 factor (ECF subfamily)